MRRGVILCALSSACALLVASGCAVDSSTPVDRSEGASASSSPAASENSLSQAVLLSQVRLSPTRTTQFWELTPGELVVVQEGRIDTDAPPSESEAAQSPLELFSSLTHEAPPEQLVQAQARAVEVDARWSQLKSAPKLVEGPGALRPSERNQELDAKAVGREFLGASWWETTACAESGYTQAYTLVDNNERYYPYLGCWSDPMRWVSTGSVGIAMTWDARFYGLGSSASYKHWYISCTDYVLFTNCNWKSENYSVDQGYWKSVTAASRKTRAGEMHTPNDNGSGYFGVRFFGTSLAVQNFCRNDISDCSHWPYGI